ncbi:hypothetical protein [Sneathiella sp.]|uniref:hypothetical protein n=1 Tax=Sneathiella sp. TaxID=1964365 RepID=UPI003566808E
MNSQAAMPDSPGTAGPMDITPHERLALTSIVAATLLLTTAMLTTIGILGEWPSVTRAATIVLGVFIAFEIFRVPAQQLVTGGVLIAIGTLAALPSDGVFDVLKRASEGTLIFAAMFSAVAFLQYPALNSPSMYAAREVVVSQPSGRRYATLSVAAHLFGALTNFATLSLLSTFLSGNLEESARERMACAMIRGFALAASWSPFFISIAVVLYVLPELKWLQIALPGIPLATLLLVYGWAYDKLTSKRHTVLSDPSIAPAPKKLEWSVIRKIGVLAITLVGMILATTELLKISTPIAIFLVTPIIALVWQWLLVRAKKMARYPTCSVAYSAGSAVSGPKL